MNKRLKVLMVAAVLSFGAASVSQPAEALFWSSIKKGWKNLKKNVKKTTKQVAKPLKRVYTKIKKALTKKKTPKKPPKKPVAPSNPLLRYTGQVAPYLKTMNCGQAVFDKLQKRIDLKWKSSGWWYPATCGAEFTRGMACALPNMIADSRAFINDAAVAAWQARSLCVPYGTAGLNAVTAATSIACGAVMATLQKVANLPRCLKSVSGALQSHNAALGKILTQVGCNLAGEIAFDMTYGFAGSTSKVPVSIVNSLRRAAQKFSTIEELASRVERSVNGTRAVCR